MYLVDRIVRNISNCNMSSIHLHAGAGKLILLSARKPGRRSVILCYDKSDYESFNGNVVGENEMKLHDDWWMNA